MFGGKKKKKVSLFQQFGEILCCICLLGEALCIRAHEGLRHLEVNKKQKQNSSRLNFAFHQNFQTSRTKEYLCRGPCNKEHAGVRVLRNTTQNTLLIEKLVCECFVLVDGSFPEPGDGPRDGPDTRLLGDNVSNSVS